MRKLDDKGNTENRWYDFYFMNIMWEIKVAAVDDKKKYFFSTYKKYFFCTYISPVNLTEIARERSQCEL